MALIRTDYGLIYNTDGSLCATLLPEGGVAVDIWTQNRVLNPSFETDSDGDSLADNWIVWIRSDGDSQRTHTIRRVKALYGQGYAQRVQITAAGNTNMTALSATPPNSITVDANTDYTFSVYGRASVANKVVVSIQWLDSNKIAIREDTSNQSFQTTTSRVKVTVKSPSNAAYANLRIFGINQVGEWFEVDAAQFENRPFATAFASGFRTDGALSVPVNNININENWTIAKQILLNPFFMENSYNTCGRSRLPLIEIGAIYYQTGHGVVGVYGGWFSAQPGKQISIVANIDQIVLSSDQTVTLSTEEYSNPILVVFTKSGLLLRAYLCTVSTIHELSLDISSLGDISQITPQINLHTVAAINYEMYSIWHKNLLVRPYAVSIDEVKTWHSLNAPFYDPREQIDAGARKIYAPGVLIDNTGAWGIANGVRQAGFGTDGKWMAGGGAVVADAAGIRSSNGSFSIGTDGNAFFGGTLDVNTVRTENIVSGSLSTLGLAIEWPGWGYDYDTTWAYLAGGGQTFHQAGFFLISWSIYATPASSVSVAIVVDNVLKDCTRVNGSSTQYVVWLPAGFHMFEGAAKAISGTITINSMFFSVLQFKR